MINDGNMFGMNGEETATTIIVGIVSVVVAALILCIAIGTDRKARLRVEQAMVVEQANRDVRLVCLQTGGAWTDVRPEQVRLTGGTPVMGCLR